MNIAHVIPYSIGYPLTSHNGRYEWVLTLATLQAQAGHNVTIYGNPNSFVDGVTTRGISTSSDDKKANNIATFELAFAGDHDVYHSHLDSLHYEVAHLTQKPIIYTQHWWPSESLIELAGSTNGSNVWAVPPTQYMNTIDTQTGIQTKGFIYHGIDLNKFQPSGNEKSGRLLFVSRIAPEKNVDIAIAVAQQTGLGLDIIGKVAPKNEAYWQSLAGAVDGVQIRYLGGMPQEELVEYYSSALGVLCPYDITEPFGLVSIEAQACGAPIVMKRGGSRAELLKEGVTGFLCDDTPEFVEASKKLGSLNAADCVAFAQTFDVRAMAKEYETLYSELI